MLLSVDDFGCVPDGRYLEKVSIQAGSTVLGVADGTVRPTDVGKRIAVPRGGRPRGDYLRADCP